MYYKYNCNDTATNWAPDNWSFIFSSSKIEIEITFSKNIFLLRIVKNEWLAHF